MKRYLRGLKFAALGLLAIVGLSLIWFAVANAQLEKKLAELRAAGQPLSLADLARKPIPPDSNAATFLRRGKDDVDAINIAVEEVWEKNAKDVQEFYEAMKSSPVIEAYRQSVAAHPGAWPLLEKASQCPQFDPQFDFSTGTQTLVANMLPLMQDQRAAIRFLHYRAVVLVADGKREEAFDTCLAMLRLAKHCENNPALVGFLVAIAVERVAIDTTNIVLRSGPLPPAVYDDLAKELARHDVAKAYQHNVVTERASCMQAFAELRGAADYLHLPSVKNDQYSCLEMFEALSQLVAKPYYDDQSRDNFQAVVARAGTMTKLLSPAIEATIAAAVRAQAQLRALGVLNAILAREHSGKTGEPKLADLGLPAETTTDPFDGQPLHLKKSADGWLIYSVGHNLKDDGGKLDDDRTDVGLGPIPN